jgi:hypothetical protein
MMPTIGRIAARAVVWVIEFWPALATNGCPQSNSATFAPGGSMPSGLGEDCRDFHKLLWRRFVRLAKVRPTDFPSPPGKKALGLAWFSRRGLFLRSADLCSRNKKGQCARVVAKRIAQRKKYARLVRKSRAGGRWQACPFSPGCRLIERLF